MAESKSFLTGKKIKRTRYAHQVSLTCLLKLSKDAFKNQEERSDKSFEEWKDEVSQMSATASFWFKCHRIGDIAVHVY